MHAMVWLLLLPGGADREEGGLGRYEAWRERADVRLSVFLQEIAKLGEQERRASGREREAERARARCKRMTDNLAMTVHALNYRSARGTEPQWRRGKKRYGDGHGG